MTTKSVNNLKMLIKQAKSAKTKAKELAIRAGKPTMTGVATGAGLGAILAAAGALSRSGEDPENVSILSNPLLLGTLGTAGGYLAGNAFERIPEQRDSKDLSATALTGLLGGTGLVGRHLAKADAEKGISKLKSKFNSIVRRIPFATDEAGNRIFPIGKRQNRDGKWVDVKPRNAAERRILEAERNEFTKARDAYQKALLRSGNVDEAIKNVGYKRPEKLGRRLLAFLNNSPSSPKNILKAFNPMKGRKLLSQLGDFFSGSGSGALRFIPKKTSARVAALALLAGGGKAIYDKVSD